MSSPTFKYFGRPLGRPFERLEQNAAGDVLKKYGGTSKSWPTHSIVQSNGMTHKEQQSNISKIESNISEFFKNKF